MARVAIARQRLGQEAEDDRADVVEGPTREHLRAERDYDVRREALHVFQERGDVGTRSIVKERRVDAAGGRWQRARSKVGRLANEGSTDAKRSWHHSRGHLLRLVGCGLPVCISEPCQIDAATMARTVTDFEERVTRDSMPIVRAEHELRYRAARSLILASDFWVDLGSGAGTAAATVLGSTLPKRVLLVDNSADALAEALDVLGGATVETLNADLATTDGVDAVRRRIGEAAFERGCVTCFELIEHLADITELVQFLVDLVHEDGRVSVVLSVPNDDFTAVENPFHQRAWGQRTVEELSRLVGIPVEVIYQLPLQGSALAFASETRRVTFTVDVNTDAVPTHFLVAFGARSAALSLAEVAVQADLAAQRAWERLRESDLAYYRAVAADRQG